MVKKNLFSLRSKKKDIQDFSIPEKVKKYFIDNKIKIGNKYKNSIAKINKVHKDKIFAIKKFFLIITGYGLVLNYSIHFIFGINFNLFTLFAWGIAYYFISDEFVEWFRRLIAKK